MKKYFILLLVLCAFAFCACDTHTHSFTEAAGVEPDCTSDGITSKKECDCGYVEGGEVLSSLGHDWKDMPEKLATVHSNGHTAYKLCSRCNAEEGKQETVFVCTHNYISNPAKPATPTQKGHTAYTRCSICGDTQGYSETEYTYPCVDLLPPVYDRISIFNLPESAKREILGMYEAVMAFDEKYAFQSYITIEQLEQYYKILAFSLPETMMIVDTFRYHYEGEKVTSITFDYILTQKQYTDRMSALEKPVKSLLSAVEGKSDFEKVKYFHNYLVEKCTYTLDAEDVNNAYGAIVNGINNCDGYSDAMNLLCNASGVKCQTVLGYTAVYHAWNIVNISGKYYYLDMTTDDVDWYGKPLYVVFGASRKYIETIGYSLHPEYSAIVPAALSELNIVNRYMPSIKVGQNIKTAMTDIANEIVKNKPNHIYIQCDGQEVFEEAKSYNNKILRDTIEKAYPGAEVEIMNKTTYKIICIVVTY